jgi:N utilization substance protein B
MKSSRRRSREFALQALYAWQLGGASLQDLAAHAAEADDFKSADSAFFHRLLGGVIAEAAGLREAIDPLLDRSWDALSPVERGILMLAAYELKFIPEVPFRVVLNEAVEIAKSFGGSDGFKYVNGVLDRLGKALRPGEVAR